MMNSLTYWYPLCRQYEAYKWWNIHPVLGSVCCMLQEQVRMVENEITSLH